MTKPFMRAMTLLRSAACLALTVCLLALCAAASAEPRYPARQGSVTDAAAVLSQSTVSDLGKVCEELEDETGVNLIVATVDFLDGESLARYGEGLRALWKLDDDDLLLLLAVGEDKFASFGGDDVTERLTAAVQQKLLSAHLEEPFLAQDYDGALRAYVPALVSECAKLWDETVDIGGLLGAPSATAAPIDVEEWLLRRVESTREETRHTFRVTEEDEDTGVSLFKVILTVFLLMVIFGKKNRRGRRNGCGCGCMPFSSILAALGLWKLWDKD